MSTGDWDATQSTPGSGLPKAGISLYILGALLPRITLGTRPRS